LLNDEFDNGFDYNNQDPKIKVIFGNNLSKEHEKNSKKILQPLNSKIIDVRVCRKSISIKSSPY